jgi:hypothetical protein
VKAVFLKRSVLCAIWLESLDEWLSGTKGFTKALYIILFSISELASKAHVFDTYFSRYLNSFRVFDTS